MPVETEDRSTVMCARCTRTTSLMDSMQVGNGSSSKHICFRCINTYYTTCQTCKLLLHITASYTVNATNYCEECYHASFRQCHGCHTTYAMGEMTLDSVGQYMCGSCAPSHVRCTTSGAWLRIEEAILYNGNYYQRDNVPVRHKINRHSFKPTPKFHGKKNADSLFFGVELEIEGGGYNAIHCDTLMSVVNPIERDIGYNMYGKHDGSVDEGFELVTHPASFEYHMNHLDWEGLCAKALELGYRKEPGTCGLHVHISRRYFGQSEVRQDIGVMKMLYLVEKFWDKVLQFSRRTEAQVDRWASRYGMRSTPQEILRHAKIGHGRYKAVNLENEHTVELRIFNGTLDYQIILATIQFCYVLATVGKTTSIQDITCMTWEEFAQRGSDYHILKSYLQTRQLLNTN